MKKILFVCIENSCRSQMAEALAKFHGRGEFEIASAGSHPSGRLHPAAVQVLKERGLPIEEQYSKGLDDLPGGIWDAAVTMGCGDECPNVRAKKRLEWSIEAPTGNDKDLGFFRKILDEIESKVIALLEDFRK